MLFLQLIAIKCSKVITYWLFSSYVLLFIYYYLLIFYYLFIIYHYLSFIKTLYQTIKPDIRERPEIRCAVSTNCWNCTLSSVGDVSQGSMGCQVPGSWRLPRTWVQWGNLLFRLQAQTQWVQAVYSIPFHYWML